ncbi:hypothetical protein TWF481_009565 [Arthrobotrys musiformis]|uniref:Uncharacterized protein n=1 Tax=Arthrobotrys musiformis TaxID=47236 RepID=A0AAV9W439_9PEZI
MSHLQTLTRTLPLASRASARAATTLLTHNYSTATETARPKTIDPAAFEGKPNVGNGGEVKGKVSEVKKPGPKIHNTAGVFDGEKRDVERHNREFRERHDRERDY